MGRPSVGPSHVAALMARVLIFGKNGQVAKALSKALERDHELICLGSDTVDLRHCDRVVEAIQGSGAKTIINAAAYTAVDDAEVNREVARKINVEAVATMAVSAKETGARLIHFSSDYVFDGNKQSPYLETDTVSPINFYGKTKIDSENNVRASGCDHWIFRTSWVFSRTGKNFIKTIVRLAKEQDEISIVDDQIGAPTSAAFIAKTVSSCLMKLEDLPNGTYHLTAAESGSWYDVGVEAIRHSRSLGLPIRTDEGSIHKVTSKEFPTPARRPTNSVLNCEKLFTILNAERPGWKTQLKNEFQSKEDFG